MAALSRSASVCAVVPHHETPEWLAGSLVSLLHQTRPLDAIVVIDDASREFPGAMAERFPEVTFLRAAENVGPYRLVQTVIDQTNFGAYLFQDADDLSHPERLAVLLDAAQADGAEIVGSGEVQLDVVAPEARPRQYPRDVNHALRRNPIAFALLHPTSLVARDALLRAGGFGGGLRFSGDVEFLWRAAHVARIRNVDRALYLRRRHRRSLTGSSGTGIGSPARRKLDGALRERARANAAAVSAGNRPDLTPFASAPPVALEHWSGPPLATADAARPRRRPAVAGRRSSGPVLVVGAPRNGGDLLAWALDLHPAFSAVAAVTAPGGRRPVRAGPSVTARALELADRYPDARFVWVERDTPTTVDSLRVRPDAHSDFFSEASARAEAERANRVCALLRAALGDRVWRIGLDQLISDPSGAVEECLRFLGEESSPLVPLPFAGLGTAARRRVTADVKLPPGEARRRLEAEPEPPGPLPARLRRMVSPLLSERAVVAVVSKGDPSLLELGAGRARHFPATDEGDYAGEYPATGEAAVEWLERARSAGTTHLLIPAPAGWWLTHYDELRRHLDRRYRVLARAEGTGLLYELSPCAAKVPA